MIPGTWFTGLKSHSLLRAHCRIGVLWGVLLAPAVIFAATKNMRRTDSLVRHAVGQDCPTYGGEVTFVVHTTKGEDHAGPLHDMTDGAIHLKSSAPIKVPAGELVSLARQNQPRPACPLGPQFVFTNGDRLPLSTIGPLSLANDIFHVEPAVPVRLAKGKRLNMPMPFVAMMWLQAPRKTLYPEGALRRLLLAKRKQDEILLTNGDRITGTINALDRQKGCTIRVGQANTIVALDRIAALAFSTRLLARVPPPAAFAKVVFSNGGRLSVTDVKLARDKKSISAKSLFRFPIQIPIDTLIALDRYSDQVTYLSDMKVSRYEHTPFFGQSWPLVRDGDAAGGSLVLKGLGTYEKGLGFHTGSRVTFALAGKYKWLESRVGMDAHSGTKGLARISVEVDGKEIHESKQDVTPQWLRLSVRGAKTVTLVVRPDKHGNVQGHVNWGQARLVK